VIIVPLLGQRRRKKFLVSRRREKEPRGVGALDIAFPLETIKKGIFAEIVKTTVGGAA